jgi:hypothetical protein
MGHSRAQADKLAESLRALPGPPPKDALLNSKKAMVSYLRAQIIGLQERRYTLTAIVAALRAGGLDIAASTLKTYLYQLRVASRGRQRKSRRPSTAVASRGLLIN